MPIHITQQLHARSAKFSKSVQINVIEAVPILTQRHQRVIQNVLRDAVAQMAKHSMIITNVFRLVYARVRTKA